MSLHRSTAGFERAPDVYERARPPYPDEAADWLADLLEIGTATVVLDLAAGTGKFTRALARTRARLVAVEPLPAMLALLREALPEVDALEGTAESIPLPDASVDVVTVAQAFHWLDARAALPEIHRVLRAGGHFVVAYNNDRVTDHPARAALSELLAPYKGDTPRRADQDVRAIVAASGLFRLAAEHRVHNEQTLGPGGLVERFHSTSFIAALPDAERERALARAREFEARLPSPLVLPYDTELVVYETA